MARSCKRKQKQQRRKPPPSDAGRCEGCDQPLGIPGGYAGTGLCGPCCTGEAETFTERWETW